MGFIDGLVALFNDIIEFLQTSPLVANLMNVITYTVGLFFGVSKITSLSKENLQAKQVTVAQSKEIVSLTKELNLVKKEMLTGNVDLAKGLTAVQTEVATMNKVLNVAFTNSNLKADAKEKITDLTGEVTKIGDKVKNVVENFDVKETLASAKENLEKNKETATNVVETVKDVISTGASYLDAIKQKLTGK